MTVTTVFAHESDAYIASSSSIYSAARTGLGSSKATNRTTDYRVGQFTDGASYQLYEVYVGFDTSVVGSDTVTAVSLELFGKSDNTNGTLDPIGQARSTPGWEAPASVESSNWVDASTLDSITTLLATLPYDDFVDESYCAFTEEGNAFQKYINRSGYTSILIIDKNTVDGNVPVAEERMIFQDTSNDGTTEDPKLVLTHEYIPPTGQGLLLAGQRNYLVRV